MITATGIGSGLDIEGLVSQLVAAERTPPETRLANREIALTAELSAFGVFKSSLASFQNSLSDLTRLSTFGQRTATSGDSDIIGVSADGGAAESSYDLTVTQLAKAHSLASGSFGSVDEVVGSGELTIRFGTTDYTPPDPGPESYNQFTVNPERGAATITIDGSNNTLEGVRKTINEADIGVAAVIVNDGSGYRLLLSSEQTGENNSLEIAVTDTGDDNDTDATGLSALAFNAGATNLDQTVVAQDALFSVNGLAITSPDNAAEDVIDGVDITLKELTGAIPVTVSISEDRASVKQAVSGFVNAYNAFVRTAADLTAYDPETGAAAALQGDFSARSIANQLRQTVVNAVEGFNGPFSSLSEIGITTQTDGTLEIDAARIDEVLENDFDRLVGLFAAVGFPSDSGVDFLSATDETTVASHALNISQLATRGELVGAAAAFPLDIDADNDEFTINIDGISSEGISLTRGSYASGSDLAAEIQARINGDATLSEAGMRVSVEYTGGQFAITSEQYGSSSRVEITAIDTNTTAELGLSVAAGTAGLNVAGTLGGVAATGTGNFLTGAAGSPAGGLQLLINGGGTGDRGVVDFSRGIAFQLNAMIDSFLDSDGILDSRMDGIEDRVEDIKDSQEALNLRMEALELRYRNQFNALDSLLSQLQTTSSFLTQQLASLPEPGSLNRDN